MSLTEIYVVRVIVIAIALFAATQGGIIGIVVAAALLSLLTPEPKNH